MGFEHDTDDPKYRGIGLEERRDSFRLTIPRKAIGDFVMEATDRWATVEISLDMAGPLQEVLALLARRDLTEREVKLLESSSRGLGVAVKNSARSWRCVVADGLEADGFLRMVGSDRESLVYAPTRRGLQALERLGKWP